jgi:hypothetical protein
MMVPIDATLDYYLLPQSLDLMRRRLGRIEPRVSAPPIPAAAIARLLRCRHG